MSESPAICDLCGGRLVPHEHYVVRIDVFADPSVPAITTQDIAGMDAESSVAGLIAQMKQMSADDLQDGVHRRFEYRLCGNCQRLFLANPLGKPRQTRQGDN